jgi:hypothetical protein
MKGYRLFLKGYLIVKQKGEGGEMEKIQKPF